MRSKPTGLRSSERNESTISEIFWSSSTRPNDADRAARLRGAVAQLNSDAGVVVDAYYDAGAELESYFERELAAVLGEDAWEQEKSAGSTMTLEEAIAVARFLCDGAEAVASTDS